MENEEEMMGNIYQEIETLKNEQRRESVKQFDNGPQYFNNEE